MIANCTYMYIPTALSTYKIRQIHRSVLDTFFFVFKWGRFHSKALSWEEKSYIAIAFNSTFRYIDDVLFMNYNQFHLYFHSIFQRSGNEKKHTTECSTSASYLDVLLILYINGKITTQRFDKRSPSSTFLTNVIIFQLYLHMVYSHRSIVEYKSLLDIWSVLVRGSLLKNKLMLQGFQLSRLQAAFRKFFGRYNDLISPYNLSLCHMLSNTFHTNH
jgi:hypothetical protein